jgi:hypothetical protein
MITDPAKFTLDAIDHLRTIEDEDGRFEYFDVLLESIAELDSETASRILYNLVTTVDITSRPSKAFAKFHIKHSRYIIESVMSPEHQKYKKLYTREDILNK